MHSNHNILRRLCKAMKGTGLGDYWHENPNDTSYVYKTLQWVMFLHFYSFILLEVLEIIFYRYPTDIHNDTISNGICQIIITSRLHVILHKKENIRKLHRFLIKDCKGYEENKVLMKQYNKVKYSVLIQICIAYGICLAYIIDGLQRKFKNNMPFFIYGVYWPNIEDDSYLALAARIIMVLILLVMVWTMICADSLAITHLILLSFKFVNLRKYFKCLRDHFENKEITAVELKNKCLEGLHLHRKLIKLTTKIYECFGLMMSIQVCQGSFVAVLLLLKVALSSSVSFLNLILTIVFIVGLFIQLGLYFWNAGEVTYQASLISTAIFHCGWETRGVQCRDECDLRRIVLMGCAQAQRPLLMKAFGIQNLSYQSFVSVVRATYSLFAVLY